MLGIEFDSFPRPAIVAAQFATWGLDIRSFREPLKRSVQQVMAPSIQKNFDVGGRPAWPGLSEDRLRQKNALGYPTDTLIATGKLKRVAGQLNAWTITSDDAAITDLPGAEHGFAHQDGVEEHNLPQREFLAIQPEDEEKIEEIFADWITERAMKAGLFAVAF